MTLPLTRRVPLAQRLELRIRRWVSSLPAPIKQLLIVVSSFGALATIGSSIAQQIISPSLIRNFPILFNLLLAAKMHLALTLVFAALFLLFLIVLNYFGRTLKDEEQLRRQRYVTLQPYLTSISKHYASVDLPIGNLGRPVRAILPTLSQRPELPNRGFLFWGAKNNILRAAVESAQVAQVGGVVIQGAQSALNITPRRRQRLRDEDRIFNDLLNSRNQSRMVIVGIDGAGKTTLLHYMVSHVAANETPKRYQNLIPIYLSLAEFEHAQRPINEYLAQIGAANALPLSQDSLAKAMQAGQVFLCLDDFDSIEPDRRLALIASIIERTPVGADQVLAKIDAFSGVIVLASRTAEYLPDTWAKRVEFSSRFSTWDIQPLNEQNAANLAKELFDTFRQSRADKQETANGATPIAAASDLSEREFLTKLEAHPRRDDLMLNPLFFTLAALSYYTQRDIPLSRAEMYQNAIDRTLAAHEVEPLWQAALRQVAGDVALYLYEREQSELSDEELIAQFIDRKMSPADAVTLANRLVSSDLIEERLGRYFFRHPTFKDYFTASALVRPTASAASEQDAIIGEKRRRWLEIDALMTGIIARRTDRNGFRAAIKRITQQRAEGEPYPLSMELALHSLSEMPHPSEKQQTEIDELQASIAEQWSTALATAINGGDMVLLSHLLRLSKDIARLQETTVQPLVTTFVTNLHDNDMRMRMPALLALAGLGRYGVTAANEGLDALLPSAQSGQDAHWMMRLIVLLEIGARGKKADIKALAPFLKDSNVILRLGAAFALSMPDVPYHQDPFKIVFQRANDAQTKAIRDALVEYQVRKVANDWLNWIEEGSWLPWLEPLLIASTLFESQTKTLFQSLDQQDEPDAALREGILVIMGIMHWLSTGDQAQFATTLTQALQDKSEWVRGTAVFFTALLTATKKAELNASMPALLKQFYLRLGPQESPLVRRIATLLIDLTGNQAETGKQLEHDADEWVSFTARTKDVARRAWQGWKSLFAQYTANQHHISDLWQDGGIALYAAYKCSTNTSFQEAADAFLDEMEPTYHWREQATQRLPRIFAAERWFWRFIGWRYKSRLRGHLHHRQPMLRAFATLALGAVLMIEASNEGREARWIGADKQRLMRRCADRDALVQVTAITTFALLNAATLAGVTLAERPNVNATVRRLRMQPLTKPPASAPESVRVAASFGVATLLGVARALDEVSNERFDLRASVMTDEVRIACAALLRDPSAWVRIGALAALGTTTEGWNADLPQQIVRQLQTQSDFAEQGALLVLAAALKAAHWGDAATFDDVIERSVSGSDVWVSLVAILLLAADGLHTHDEVLARQMQQGSFALSRLAALIVLGATMQDETAALQVLRPVLQQDTDRWVKFAAIIFLATQYTSLLKAIKETESADEASQAKEALAQEYFVLFLGIMQSEEFSLSRLVAILTVEDQIPEQFIQVVLAGQLWYLRLAISSGEIKRFSPQQLTQMVNDDDLGERLLALMEMQQRLDAPPEDADPQAPQPIVLPTMTALEQMLVRLFATRETESLVAIFAMGFVQAAKDWAADTEQSQSWRMQILGQVVQGMFANIHAPTAIVDSAMRATSDILPASFTATEKESIDQTMLSLVASLHQTLDALIPLLVALTFNLAEESTEEQAKPAWQQLQHLLTDAAPEIRALVYQICRLQSDVCNDDIIKQLRANWVAEKNQHVRDAAENALVSILIRRSDRQG